MSSFDSAPAPADSTRIGRRSRLREFQSQLVERMQAARSGGARQTDRLGLVIGDTHWLVSLREAGEIVAPGTITPVPLTQDWFLGLTNVRGNLLGVIDFARFEGRGSVAPDKESRILSFSPALSFNCGLLVTRVLGLRSLAQMESASAADAGAAPPWAGKRYADREAQIWNELDLSLLVQDPRFLDVAT